MKVLFISRRFYPEVIGGGQVSAFYIAKAAKMAGCDVYVCTFTDEKKYEEITIEGIKIYRMPISKIKKFSRLSNMDYMYFEMAWHATKIIKKIKPDILHLLNFESIPGAAIYYKLRFKIPIFATVNGPIFGCFVQSSIDYKEDTCIDCKAFKRFYCSKKKWGLFGLLYYVYSFWYMNLLKLSYRFVDRFFLVSNAMKEVMINMGVNNNKLVTIYNPTDKKKLVRTDLKSRLGIKGKKVLLYIGRLTKEKGIEKVIKIMPKIKNTTYVIVGEKRNDYEYFRELCEKLNVKDRVIFTGFIDQNKLLEYYSIADACILIETFFEPLSRFLLEAVSLNIPIIANDIGGNMEIINFNKKNNHLIKNNSDSEIILAINKSFKLKRKKKDIKIIEPLCFGKKLNMYYKASLASSN